MINFVVTIGGVWGEGELKKKEKRNALDSR